LKKINNAGRQKTKTYFFGKKVTKNVYKITDRCEPVDSGKNVEQFAADIAEDPLLTHGCCDEKRQTHQKAKIRHGQVDYVAVCHRPSHLGISAQFNQSIIHLFVTKTYYTRDTFIWHYTYRNI